jgi:hypothetical protein
VLSHVTCLEYNRRDPYLLLTGGSSGELCLFDTRNRFFLIQRNQMIIYYTPKIVKGLSHQIKFFTTCVVEKAFVRTCDNGLSKNGNSLFKF